MNRKPNKKHVYLTGAQKKDMIGQFIDGYNAEELAARFDVSYKTAIKVLRPTRVAMLAARKAAEAVDAMKTKPKLVKADWKAASPAPAKPVNHVPMSEEATDFILGLSLVHKVSRKEAVDMVIKSAREKYATI
jgi:hypothetical protein